jgi:hypothetical protein
MLAHGEKNTLAARTSWKFISLAIAVLALWKIVSFATANVFALREIVSLTATLTLWNRISAVGWKKSFGAFAGWSSAVLSYSEVAKLGSEFWGSTLKHHWFCSTEMLGAFKFATIAGEFIVGIIIEEVVITEDIRSLVDYPDSRWRGRPSTPVKVVLARISRIERVSPQAGLAMFALRELISSTARRCTCNASPCL